MFPEITSGDFVLMSVIAAGWLREGVYLGEGPSLLRGPRSGLRGSSLLRGGWLGCGRTCIEKLSRRELGRE
jgi:hypothetical protein